jgi:hypothetical protein
MADKVVTCSACGESMLDLNLIDSGSPYFCPACGAPTEGLSELIANEIERNGYTISVAELTEQMRQSSIDDQRQVASQLPDQILRNLAINLMTTGHSDKEVERLIDGIGVDFRRTPRIVGAARSEIVAARRQSGERKLQIGGLALVGGLVFSLISYGSASPGGQYTVAIGAIVFGAIQLGIGYVQTR